MGLIFAVFEQSADVLIGHSEIDDSVQHFIWSLLNQSGLSLLISKRKLVKCSMDITKYMNPWKNILLHKIQLKPLPANKYKIPAAMDMSITTIAKSFRNSHFVWMFIKDLVGIVIIDQRIIAFESSFFTS